MLLYHANIPQYDDVLNNTRLKLHMLDVPEVRNELTQIKSN